MSSETTRLPGYETTFITKNELSDDGLKKIQEKFKSVVSSFGGEVCFEEDWGKRKLAYEIQKETRGHYTYVIYTGKAGVVAELERNFRLQEPVLRYLTVKLEDEFESADYIKKYMKMKEAAKRRESEREAARAERKAFRESRDRDGGGYRDRGDR